MIKEIKLKHFDTNDPTKHECTPYPVVNDELPKLFPCGAFCGAVGSGKTSQACRLLGKYIKLGAKDPVTLKPLMQRCILFSPSIDSNPVWNAIPEENLAKVDRISGYTDDKLKEIWDGIKQEKRLHDKYKLEMKTSKDDFDTLPLEIQQWLEGLDFKPPEPKCKYPQGVIYHMILDDCLGQSCFKSQRKSLFTKFLFGPPTRANVHLYLHPKHETGPATSPIVHQPLGTLQVCRLQRSNYRLLSRDFKPVD
jgi:hypothetical protein